MRALISPSITVAALNDVMTSIQTNTDMGVDAILKKVQSKCAAIVTRESLTDTSSGTVGACRGEARKSSSQPNGQTKRTGPWKVPRLPVLTGYAGSPSLAELIKPSTFS